MRISLFLPHVGVFGGVRRYLELGNAWSEQGHAVTLFHPDGTVPGWLPFAGAIMPLAAAREVEAELAFSGDPHTWDAFRAHRSQRHVYYCVLERDPGLARAIADPAVVLAANSTDLRRSVERRSRRPVLDGIGGIRLTQFHPEPSRRPRDVLRVLVNGRRSRPKKGTDLILAALESITNRVPRFEIVLFDSLDAANARDPRDGAALPANARYVLNPSQDELAELYRSAHVFLAAERKAGWCNTAIEAMASGCAVACTRSGTRDFARHEETALVVPVRHAWLMARAARRLLSDEALRTRLEAAAPAAAIPWSWDRLATRLLDQLVTTAEA